METKKKNREKRLDMIGICCGVLLVILAIVSIVASNAAPVAGVKDSEIPAEAVTLTGTAPGRNGDVTVEVVATADRIYRIKVLDHQETEGIGTEAVKNLPVSIFQAQNLQVDAVSGATISSNAIKAAVIDALNNGGIKANAFGGSLIKVEQIALQPNLDELMTETGIQVLTASHWAETYPEIYASWARNGENDEAEDYLEIYPMLSTLYEPYGFSFDYNAARGHMFDVEDVTSTERPHPNASCFTCKTPYFTAMVLEQGNAAYAVPFKDVEELMTEPISCFNCHANTPGKVTVTHTYLIDGVGEDFESIDAANLACGQCHNEYFFNPNVEGKPTTLPHTSLESMSPDAILAFYNDPANWPDGVPIADYTNPRTGVRQIKVQHPELETYLGEGSQHRNTYTCADCHMGTAVAENGKTYTSHYLSSPLDNPDLIKNECSKCHVDLAAEVKKTQEEVECRTYGVGYQLQYLTERLAQAVESGSYSEKELEEIRSLARDAQFYWDFVFVENAEGAHNPALTYDCLDKAETLCNQALNLLKK